MTGLPPGVTTTSSGVEGDAARARSTSAAMASRSSGMPGGGRVVGAALVERLRAASTMCAGVSKSGSPISRWMIVAALRLQRSARASTSKAVSVPSCPILCANFIGLFSTLATLRVMRTGCVVQRIATVEISQLRGMNASARPACRMSRN